MANPITWRSLQSNPAAGVGGLLRGAESSFNGAFDTLNSQLKDYQQTDADNWKLGKEQNTNQYLDKINSFKTIEELAAAQASGELDALKSQYGAQVDSTAIRGADAAMLDTLRNRAIQTVEYNNTQRDEREAPIIDRIKSLYAQNKPEEAQALALQNDFRNDAAVAEYGQTQLNNYAKMKYAANADRRAGSEEARQIRAANENTTLFNQKQDSYRDIEAYNRLTREAMIEDEQVQSAAARAEQDVFGQFGAVDQNGNIDTTQLSADKLQEAKSALANHPDIIRAQERSSKVIQEGLRSSVASLKTLSPESVATAGNIVYQAEATRETLQGDDKAAFDTKLGEIERTFSTRDSTYNLAFEEVARNNPFVKELSTESKVSPEVLLSWMGEKDKDGNPLFDPAWSNEAQKKGMLDTVADTVNKPMKLGNFEGVVPQSVVKRALLEIDGNSGRATDLGDQLKTSIRRIMEREGTVDSILQAQNAVDQHRSILAQSATEKLKKVSELTHSSNIGAGNYKPGESEQVLARQLATLAKAEQALRDAKTAEEKSKAEEKVKEQSEKVQEAQAVIDLSSGNPTPQNLSDVRAQRKRDIEVLMKKNGFL